MPAVSLIVSTYNDSDLLACCLASINCQTIGDWEIIVTDNSDSQIERGRVIDLCDGTGIDCAYIQTDMDNPYSSAEVAFPRTRGKWIGFPSSDGYMVPTYLERMLKAVEADSEAGLIYCDILYDPRASGKYSVMETRPQMCSIDKTCFLVRRDLFNGFPEVSHVSPSDGLLIEDLMRRGVKAVKVPGALVVHN